MPLYDKLCSKCEELFEVQCKISEKEQPKECPYCGSMESVYMLSAPAVSMESTRFMTHKRDAGFQQVISKIAERNPNTPICERV